MTNIKIGFGETDITPKGKIKLAGQFYERITDEVESQVSVTALALECGKEQAVICSCDLESVTENLVEKVRDNLKNVDGLNTKKVIVCVLEVIGNRHNTLGALHNINTDVPWCTPYKWRPEPEEMSYGYHTRSFGVLKSPVIRLEF